MLGITPLRRSLPDTSDETNGWFGAAISRDDDVVGVAVLLASVAVDSDSPASASGVSRHMTSSSLTTSIIEGRASVSSWQHMRAKERNFSTHSEGYEPMRLSITEKVIPD